MTSDTGRVHEVFMARGQTVGMTSTWLRASEFDTLGGFALGAAIGLAFWLALLTLTGLQLGILLALLTALGVLLASAAVVLALMLQVGQEPGSGVRRRSGSSPAGV
jgi:uncharacterized RDD family membrane protein YckC